jgi:hypothetical protein
MLCRPLRSPRNSFSRFSGGDARSLKSVALSKIASFRRALVQTSDVSRLLLRERKSFSVAESAKLRITHQHNA